MSKDQFKNWIASHPKLLSSNTPSFHLDNAIANPAIQNSIKNSSANQLLFSYLDYHILVHYATVMNLTLRQSRSKFTDSDLAYSKGLTVHEKKNEVQKVYFRQYEVFAYFIKYDITKHFSASDAKINALRRWISIADKLLEMKNFDGVMLVLGAISDLAKDSLVGSLPAHYQKRFTDLSNLFSPTLSYKALRDYNSSLNDLSVLMPLAIYSTDTIHLKDVLEGDMSIDGRQTSHAHLVRMRSSFQTLNVSQKPMSSHQKRTFKAMEALIPEANPHQSVQAFYAQTPRSGESGSKLYSHALPPSFWRRSRSIDVMWEEILPLSNTVLRTR